MNNHTIQLNHPLIQREQTFVLDRKLVSIHSIDRDLKKWPNSHHFEVELPENMDNVQSMRLINISFPSNQYVFSNEYQNTKLNFIVFTPVSNDVTIIIDEGTYTPDQLANEIETKMNKKVAEQVSILGYNRFRCKYNSVTNQFWFGCQGNKFILNFDKKFEYEINCNQKIVWDNSTRWGLPAYLGYQKKKYKAEITPANPWWSPSQDGNPFGFGYEMEDGSGNEWLGDEDNKTRNVYVDLSGENMCNLDIMGEDCIYMEVEKYNSMNELEPYMENTQASFNNDYGGKVNSAFAKIPIKCTPFSQVYDTINTFISNISHYNPPIDNIKKLRFKFRYHDGRLVDFKCLPFNFTLEFNMLRDEQARRMHIRVPPLYNL